MSRYTIHNTFSGKIGGLTIAKLQPQQLDTVVPATQLIEKHPKIILPGELAACESEKGEIGNA